MRRSSGLLHRVLWCWQSFLSRERFHVTGRLTALNFLDMEMIEKMRVHLPPVDAGRLKYFAALIMLLDHITCAFLERAYGDDGGPLMYTVPGGQLLDSIGRAVGRQAFPIFCFFLVEGFLHTRSRLRYFGQLLLFAALSQVPFQRCVFPRSGTVHANVLCTLAIGLLAIWVIEAMGCAFLGMEAPMGSGSAHPGAAPGRPGSGPGTSVWHSLFSLPGQGGGAQAGPDDPHKRSEESEGMGKTGNGHAGWLTARALFLLSCGGAVYGLCRLAQVLHSDYSYGGVILIVLLYVLRDYRIASLFISWAWLSWYNRLEMYAAPAFLLLACYNGRRGRQHKYFFYVFYPAHLAVLWLVRRHLFGL